MEEKKLWALTVDCFWYNEDFISFSYFSTYSEIWSPPNVPLHNNIVVCIEYLAYVFHSKEANGLVNKHKCFLDTNLNPGFQQMFSNNWQQNNLAC